MNFPVVIKEEEKTTIKSNIFIGHFFLLSLGDVHEDFNCAIWSIWGHLFKFIYIYKKIYIYLTFDMGQVTCDRWGEQVG